MSDSMIRETLEFVKENDVKFIRLAFCDLFGFTKNISIMPDGLRQAFENGVSFDAHAIKGFRNVAESDLLLFPDPTTLATLPWRPGPGRVVRFYCDIKNPDGTPFAHDTRNILRAVETRALQMGYSCQVGVECEFYLFKTDEDGNPTDVTLDNGEYLDVSPQDKGENVRREICFTLEEMGIMPITSHHEQGPGQNEIDFKFDSALSCADRLLTFKNVVRNIASRNGLHASFMPKPILKMPGSGLHVNLSLCQNGKNIFKNKDEGHCEAAESFIAGVLAKIPEITLFLNPLANSYERFGKFEAPKYVSWSHQNRSQLVRIPAATGEQVRMELRSPDPALNPYLAFALIISAGLDGMESKLALPPSVDTDLFTAKSGVTKKLVPLPANLKSAMNLAADSSFVKRVIGDELLRKIIAIKKEEAAAFASAKDKEQFYRDRFFNRV